jgi:predicted lipoprotein with Yx(FWY)xxD motif
MASPSRKALWIAGVALLAIAFSVYSFTSGTPERARGADVDLSPLSTPAGIALQPLGKAQGTDLGKQTAARLPRDEVAYTDTRGMTLYTYDKDPNGQSSCVDECAKTFPPALAPDYAKPYGDWSVIKRPDGSRQWAHQGKPLYTYVKDVDPGSVAGNSPLASGARRRNGAGEMVGGGVRGRGVEGIEKQQLPPEWHPALLYPRSDLQLPTNVGIKEVLDAAALALVDHRGHTLYYSQRDADDTLAEERKSGRTWMPVTAPQLAEATGDFTFIQRKDGIRQWGYKGKALYTFAGDLAPGDANGESVSGWRVAAVARHFMPESVAIAQTPGLGKMLATAEGMALYKRDGYIHQSGGGYSLRRGAPTRPAVGRDIGTNARCDAECRKVWHPFVAPDNARPQGYWDVAIRDDGTKQWVYQGYALWRYDGDKKPGDINGNDRYDMALAHDPTVKIDLGTPMDAAAALYWGIMPP